MRFVRIANGDTVHFCQVTNEDQLLKLNTRADDPADYLALYLAGLNQDKQLTALAAELADRGQLLPWSLNDVDAPPAANRPHLTLPFTPPEVWGTAFTYLRGEQTRQSPIIIERRSKKPVVFFKATPFRYVGPNDAVGSRGDTDLMIPEPELGIILSGDGKIIGYTIVNDVSSRDLPRKDPLYVSYSKIFDRCVSFGPVVVDPDEVADPLNLNVTCRVTRQEEVIWDETGSTGQIYWSHRELIDHTTAHNRLPAGTLLASGTVLSPPLDMHIIEGDFLEVEIEGIGRLANPVVNV